MEIVATACVITPSVRTCIQCIRWVTGPVSHLLASDLYSLCTHCVSHSLCQSLTMSVTHYVSHTQNNKYWLALLAMFFHCYDKRRCRPLYFIGSTSGNERPLKVVSNFPIPSPIPAFQWYKEIILTAFQRRNKPYYCFVRNNKIPFVAGNFAEWRTAFYANGLFCCNW